MEHFDDARIGRSSSNGDGRGREFNVTARVPISDDVKSYYFLNQLRINIIKIFRAIAPWFLGTFRGKKCSSCYVLVGYAYSGSKRSLSALLETVFHEYK